MNASSRSSRLSFLRAHKSTSSTLTCDRRACLANARRSMAMFSTSCWSMTCRLLMKRGSTSLASRSPAQMDTTAACRDSSRRRPRRSSSTESSEVTAGAATAAAAEEDDAAAAAAAAELAAAAAPSALGDSLRLRLAPLRPPPPIVCSSLSSSIMGEVRLCLLASAKQGQKKERETCALHQSHANGGANTTRRAGATMTAAST